MFQVNTSTTKYCQQLTIKKRPDSVTIRLHRNLSAIFCELKYVITVRQIATA